MWKKGSAKWSFYDYEYIMGNGSIRNQESIDKVLNQGGDAALDFSTAYRSMYSQITKGCKS